MARCFHQVIIKLLLAPSHEWRAKHETRDSLTWHDMEWGFNDVNGVLTIAWEHAITLVHNWFFHVFPLSRWCCQPAKPSEDQTKPTPAHASSTCTARAAGSRCPSLPWHQDSLWPREIPLWKMKTTRSILPSLGEDPTCLLLGDSSSSRCLFDERGVKIKTINGGKENVQAKKTTGKIVGLANQNTPEKWKGVNQNPLTVETHTYIKNQWPCHPQNIPLMIVSTPNPWHPLAPGSSLQLLLL